MADKKSGKSKKAREIIKLNSTAGTGHYYVTNTNKRNNAQNTDETKKKVRLNKYDPVARKHVEYKEGKVK